MALPGFCDATESSISADKQSVVCVRKDFNIYNADAYSEDLTFNPLGYNSPTLGSLINKI